MAGYEDTRKMIIDTLMGREEGTMIQPQDHQDFALQITDYIHAVELSTNGSFIGLVENANIYPIQPSDQNAVYYATVGLNMTVVYENFIDINGNPLYVTTNVSRVALVVLFWNKSYWSKQVLYIPASGSGSDITLENLEDVQIDNLEDGQILKYDAQTQKFVNAADAGGATITLRTWTNS